MINLELIFQKLEIINYFLMLFIIHLILIFLKLEIKPGNIFENGLNMFLFQAQKAFSIWHNIEPKINQEVIKFLRKLIIVRLNNKIAIITGSASGFGKGIAKKFTEEGANLILVDINLKLLKKVSKNLSQDYFVADVSKASNFKFSTKICL